MRIFYHFVMWTLIAFQAFYSLLPFFLNINCDHVLLKENPRFWSGVLWESWILDFAKNAFRMYSSSNLRSKIQELRRSLVQKGQNSGFKIPKNNSWIQGGGIKEVFSEPWILNLESYPLKFGEECILNAFFAKSKIQDSHKTCKKMQFLITRKCLKL